ncbi:MAG: hypothetical protein L0338_07065 [Acidobacteria bacterium]|nr:hypothetical protein [Acidobacteriota bacterium]
MTEQIIAARYKGFFDGGRDLGGPIVFHQPQQLSSLGGGRFPRWKAASRNRAAAGMEAASRPVAVAQ